MNSRRAIIRRIGVVLIVTGAATIGWVAVRAWSAWDNVNRVAFEPAAARIALTPPETTTTSVAGQSPATTTVVSAPITTTQITSPAADERLDVYLVIGTDSGDGASQRADVILLLIIPGSELDPVMMSIPRDLYATDLCTGQPNRINVNLNGCRGVRGPDQLAVAVEDLVGLAIDHFVLFDFDSFRHVVDRVGGVEICTPYAVRDLPIKPVPLEIPAGCTVQGGYQALAWVRSRHTEGLVSGTWQPVASSDLVRNQRQQDLIVQALERVAAMGDISELTGLVEDIAPNLTVDAGLDLRTAIGTAWSLRGKAESVRRVQIPVADYTDPFGRAVLVATRPIPEVLLETSPEFAAWFAG